VRGDQGALTADYIRSMRLLQNTSRAVGDLIMTYKRLSNLAGHTARVSELLEQVGGRAGRRQLWGSLGPRGPGGFSGWSGALHVWAGPGNLRPRGLTSTPVKPRSNTTRQVEQLSREDCEHKELFRRNVSATHLLEVGGGCGAAGPPPPPRRTASPDGAIRFVR
jgi:hypothetical protein